MIEETMAIDRENEINLRKLREAFGEGIEEIGRGKNPPRKDPKLFPGPIQRFPPD